jgi:hypothetical protein
MSLLGRYPRRPCVACVLVKNHRDDLSVRVAFEIELRVENFEKKLVFGACEDREGGLPGDLRFEVIALEHEINNGTRTELVFADIIPEHGGVERNFPKFGWKLRGAQLRGRPVAVLVQDKSIDDAVGIAREAYADSDDPETRWAQMGKWGSHSVRLPGQKAVVHTEHVQEEFVSKLEGSHIVVERRNGQDDHAICGRQRRVRSSVAKPRSSASVAVLARMTTPRCPSAVNPRKLLWPAFIPLCQTIPFIGRHPGQPDANGFGHVVAGLLREFHRRS